MEGNFSNVTDEELQTYCKECKEAFESEEGVSKIFEIACREVRLEIIKRVCEVLKD